MVLGYCLEDHGVTGVPHRAGAAEMEREGYAVASSQVGNGGAEERGCADVGKKAGALRDEFGMSGALRAGFDVSRCWTTGGAELDEREAGQ